METLIRFGQTKRAAFVLAGLSIGFAANADVRVSEVMPCNISTYMVDQNYNGWVEVSNDADHSVDLGGYKFVHYKIKSDGSIKKEWEWKINESITVHGNGYTVFSFDGSEMDSRTERKLDSDGGVLVIKDKSGVSIDSFKYEAIQTHISYGVYNGNVGYMEPTPGSENSQSYRSLSSRCYAPVFTDRSAQPGVLSNNNTVIYLSTQTDGASIYYTTDGSEPSKKNGKKYDQSMGIQVEAFKNMVVRARAFKEGMMSSPILTGTFLFVDEKHNNCSSQGFTLPIVSIVTDNENLYNDSLGIYIKGNGKFSINPQTSCLDNEKLNYVMDWARPANFEYFVGNQRVLSHEVDIEVMGGCSRKYDVKSLKIKAGNRMGSGNGKLKYDFFSDKIGNVYKSLQLRNGGNGHEDRYIRCRDGFMQSIAKQMNIDYQAYQPVAFFLNGHYKGLMGLRERTNKAFVESNFGLDSKDIDVIEITNKQKVVATCGTKDAYDNLVDFLSNNNPEASDYYEKAAKLMDMDEYIDYQIFEQFIVNTDWPANNCKMWRERNNGRFRWVSFDTDFGLGLYGEDNSNYCVPYVDMFKWAKGEGSRYNWGNGDTDRGFTEDTKWKTIIFSSLMKNKTFRDKFLNRYLIQLGSTLKYDNIRPIWDSISGLVSKEFCATFDGAQLNDMEKVHTMLNFAQERPERIYKQMLDKDNFPENEGSSLVSLKLASSSSKCHVLMNGELVPNSFSGKYFSGRELKVEAIPQVGYRFLGWKSEGEAETTEVVVEEEPIDTTGLVYTQTREWTYYTDKEGLSSRKWRTLDYDEKDMWTPGYGVMGYKDGDSTGFNTFIESGSKGNHYATVYFRSVFDMDDLDDVKAIVARITFDDAYILYVNGEYLTHSNIDKSQVSGTKYAGTWANDSVETVVIPSSLLNVGKNIIAVEVHQHEAASSDLKLSFEEAIVHGAPADAPSVSTGEYVSTDPIYRVKVNGDVSLTAVFEKLGDCEQPSIRINEICASNKSAISDEYGNYSDWFEIYNDGDEVINLAGLYLTDNSRKSTKYMIPYGYEETKVAPKDRVLVWADGNSFRGALHAGFKLANTSNSYLAINMKCGDNVYVVDDAEYGYTDENNSYGLLSDGGDEWVTFGECSGGRVYSPTPGTANSSRVCNSDECFTTDLEDEIEADIEESLPVISVYPNPVIDFLNVRIQGVESFDLFVYDNLGRLMMVREHVNSDESIDMKSLASGVYHLEISTDKEVYDETIVKE